MIDKVRILGLHDRDDWDHEHGAHGLPSQSWHYAAALAASGYDPKLAIVESGGSRMLLPFFVRDWQGTDDIATLPGLSGFSIFPASPEPLALWREFSINQGWVAGYLQAGAPAALDFLRSDADLIEHNTCFLVDPTSWSLHTSASIIIRRKVQVALRSGAEVVDDPKLLAGRLPVLYEATMQRFGLTSRFSSETLMRWAESPMSLLVGVSVNGNVEGVHLIHISGRNAELHLVGTTDRGRRLSALIYAHAIQRLREYGTESYNLGGGGDPGGGLYRFKTWLGGRPLPLRALRQIYSPALYAQLCTLAGVGAEVTWFPAYRNHRLAATTPEGDRQTCLNSQF